MQPKHQDMGQVILKISVKEYFELFQKTNAPHTFAKFLEDKGHQKITCSEWKTPEDPLF